MHLRYGLGFQKKHIVHENMLNHYVQIAPAFENISLKLLDIMRDRNPLIKYIYNLGGIAQKSLIEIGKKYFLLYLSATMPL